MDAVDSKVGLLSGEGLQAGQQKEIDTSKSSSKSKLGNEGDACLFSHSLAPGLGFSWSIRAHFACARCAQLAGPDSLSVIYLEATVQ